VFNACFHGSELVIFLGNNKEIDCALYSRSYCRRILHPRRLYYGSI